MNETPATLAGDAHWLPHRVDVSKGQIHFVCLARDDHRRMAFLSDEYLDPAAPRASASFQDVAAALRPAADDARCHFIFHSAFCCSTLLTRAFDIDGRAMGLKEPAALMDLAEAGLAIGDITRIRPHLRLILHLLARPLGAGEAVIVKPTNIVNPIAEEMLSAKPEARALLLYSPLPDFLLSVAKKGLFGRIWARKSLAAHGRSPAFDAGYSQAEAGLHTDLQVAALGWLQQQAQFARLARTQPPGRVATLDSNTLLARRGEALAALDQLFGLGLSPEQLAGVVDGPVFVQNSKRHREDFDASTRALENDRAQAAYGEEVAMVVGWAESVAAHVGVPMRPEAPLLLDA